VDFVLAFLSSDNVLEIYIEQLKSSEKEGDKHVWKGTATTNHTLTHRSD